MSQDMNQEGYELAGDTPQPGSYEIGVDLAKPGSDASAEYLAGVERLPDGSAFAIGSFPLPTDHWLTRPGYNIPPMPIRMGTGPERDSLAEKVKAAGRYAVRASTMNGAVIDFDPDALVQNFIIGLLGYNTPDGLGSDAWDNPAPIPPLVTL